MRAASLNYRDLMVVSGRFGGDLPLIPLSDGVGIVEVTGEGVANVKTREHPCMLRNCEF
jgi:NADPH:quinone reductase-like Zn-dependent oxidoreductase